MLKFNLLILLTLMASRLWALDFDQIKAKELAYIKKHLAHAQLQKNFGIGDSITAKGPNKTVLLIADSQGKKLGWTRFIATDTGCQSSCLPLNFALVFDSKGNFVTYFSMEPLTKKYHRLFKEADLMQLDMILARDGPGLSPQLVPSDLVDGVTMATHHQFEGKVVKDAALTTLRMLQYKRQTERWIKLQRR